MVMKYTPQEKLKLISSYQDHILAGKSKTMAAKLVGVDPKTMASWIASVGSEEKAPAASKKPAAKPSVKAVVDTQTEPTATAQFSKEQLKKIDVYQNCLAAGKSKTASAREAGADPRTLDAWVKKLTKDDPKLDLGKRPSAVPLPVEPAKAEKRLSDIPVETGSPLEMMLRENENRHYESQEEPVTEAQVTEEISENASKASVRFVSIQLPTSLVISLNDDSLTLESSKPNYPELVEAIEQIKAKPFFRETNLITEEDAVALKTIIFGKEIQGIVDWSDGNLVYKRGVPTFAGRAIHGKLYDVLKRLADEGDKTGIQRFSKFLDKLYAAISYKVTVRLYDFVSKNNLGIAEDGDILAFKVVRVDYLDCHTGTIDNSVGKTPEMPRNKVDDQDSNTCSNGLHICSFDYIKTFRTNSSRVVVCKIDPRDFVSIPTDYNNTKARCCKYTVVRDCTDEVDTANKSGKSVLL